MNSLREATATFVLNTRWPRLMRLFGSLLLALSLSACLSGILPPVEQRPTFVLPEPKPVASARSLPGSLRVDDILAPAHLDTDAMVAIRPSGELQRVAGGRWSTRLPALLQSHTAAALERAGSAEAVVLRAGVAQLRWRLSGELREFNIGANGAVRLHSSWRLVCVNQAQSIAHTRLAFEQAPRGQDAASLAAAFAAVSERQAQALVIWLASIPSNECPP